MTAPTPSASRLRRAARGGGEPTGERSSADTDERQPILSLSIEAGDWPPEAELGNLARRAIAAGTAELRSRQLPSLSLQRGGGGASPPPWRGKGRGGEAVTELSLVFTDDAHSRELNRKHRGKDKPTNVLSFPQAAGGPLLGDVVLAAETVYLEAELAKQPVEEHIAHLIIHGFLHLIGYDHTVDEDAERMETLERAALARLGIPDPYAASR
jgi:probable rRNA maturation factor